MDVFCFGSVFSDRPVWGVSGLGFPDVFGQALEWEITGFNAGKTGLFKPVWFEGGLPGQAGGGWDEGSGGLIRIGFVCCQICPVESLSKTGCTDDRKI